MFDLFKDEELRNAFDWKEAHPLSRQDHQQKGIEYNFFFRLSIAIH